AREAEVVRLGSTSSTDPLGGSMFKGEDTRAVRVVKCCGRLACRACGRPGARGLCACRACVRVWARGARRVGWNLRGRRALCTEEPQAQRAIGASIEEATPEPPRGECTPSCGAGLGGRVVAGST